MSAPALSPTLATLAVFAEDDANHDIATQLAQRLGASLFGKDATTDDIPFLLVVATHPVHDYRLELHFPRSKLAPVCVDFQSDQLKYRQQFGGGRRQPIARAMGLKKGIHPAIVDATAGLGRDAFVLAALGCDVYMVERNPVIHALLEDGLRRLEKISGGTLAKRLHLYYADSAQWLQSRQQPVDIIYLDPMYPHRTKSALVKKEMRILRSLVGDDLDVPALLDTALTAARNRVVVKRPKTAPAISDIKPSHCIESRKTRYDVYLTSADAANGASAQN
jgi:16S rRNA (guanine1516-N2)-methyltransferase